MNQGSEGFKPGERHVKPSALPKRIRGANDHGPMITDPTIWSAERKTPNPPTFGQKVRPVRRTVPGLQPETLGLDQAQPEPKTPSE